MRTFWLRINPHEAKENIHLRPTSISRTLFRFFSFSGTSVSLSKSRDTGAAQKKELASPIQRATMLAITIGAAAPIGAVLYHHAYIGPVLVIPPRLFRGRDHLFTILPQHVHHVFTMLPQHVHMNAPTFSCTDLPHWLLTVVRNASWAASVKVVSHHGPCYRSGFGSPCRDEVL